MQIDSHCRPRGVSRRRFVAAWPEQTPLRPRWPYAQWQPQAVVREEMTGTVPCEVSATDTCARVRSISSPYGLVGLNALFRHKITRLAQTLLRLNKGRKSNTITNLRNWTPLPMEPLWTGPLHAERSRRRAPCDRATVKGISQCCCATGSGSAQPQALTSLQAAMRVQESPGQDIRA
jgi:hypothetical protein